MKKQIKAPAPQEVVERLCRNLVGGGFPDIGKTKEYAMSLLDERINFIEGLGRKIH